MFHEILFTPVGEVLLIVDAEGALTGLYTGRQLGSEGFPGVRDPGRTGPARLQIEEYFAGKRKSFDLPIALKGSPFQIQVWSALRDIPFGETRSYGQLAASLGLPAASRAVGRANGSNPISIVVPCHRVIGASGALVGYGGGLPVKKWLLEFEGAVPAQLPGLVG